MRDECMNDNPCEKSVERFMPTREVAMYLYELEAAIDAVWEKYKPEGVIADVKVKQHGEDFAELFEEGRQLL